MGRENLRHGNIEWPMAPRFIKEKYGRRPDFFLDKVLKIEYQYVYNFMLHYKKILKSDHENYV